MKMSHTGSSRGVSGMGMSCAAMCQRMRYDVKNFYEKEKSEKEINEKKSKDCMEYSSCDYRKLPERSFKMRCRMRS